MSENKKIGIIGAMPEEVEDLKQAMDAEEKKSIAGMEFWTGKLDSSDVIVVQCGIGKVNAGVCAQMLISIFGAEMIINTGVAGSLDNKINIGDIVVSVDAVQHDYDVSPIGFKKGEIPFTEHVAFSADEELRKKALEAVRCAAQDTNVFEGRVCSGDQFISSMEQKNRILDEFGGMCCEMEGAAIAQVCYLNQTPFVIIRAISDKVDGTDTMDYATFEQGAALHCSNIVKYMVKNL